MLKKICLLIVTSLFILTSVAIPSLAYIANPDDNVLGYNLITNVRLSHSYGGVTALDTLPYTVYDPRDISSDVYEVVIDDDKYFEVFFIENLGNFSVNIPPIVYRPDGLYDRFVIACRSIRIQYDAYDASGVFVAGDTIYIENDGTREVNITEVMNNELPVNADFVHLSITDVIVDERFYIDLPLIPSGSLAYECAYRTLSNDDVIVNTFIEDVPVGDFLWNSVTGMLGFEIAPNLQLYHVLLAVIVLPLLVWFLKVVAGG